MLQSAQTRCDHHIRQWCAGHRNLETRQQRRVYARKKLHLLLRLVQGNPQQIIFAAVHVPRDRGALDL